MGHTAPIDRLHIYSILFSTSSSIYPHPMTSLPFAFTTYDSMLAHALPDTFIYCIYDPHITRFGRRKQRQALLEKSMH